MAFSCGLAMPSSAIEIKLNTEMEIDGSATSLIAGIAATQWRPAGTTIICTMSDGALKPVNQIGSGFGKPAWLTEIERRPPRSRHPAVDRSEVESDDQLPAASARDP